MLFIIRAVIHTFIIIHTYPFNALYMYRPHISDSGSCDVSVSSVSLSVSVVVGADSGGHPTVKASGCSLDIGHLDITFHGGARCIILLLSLR